jgi:hypothetical protein
MGGIGKGVGYIGGIGKGVGYIGGMGIAVGGIGVAVDDGAVKVGEVEVAVRSCIVGVSVMGVFTAIWVSRATAVYPDDRVNSATIVCATRV